MKNTEASRGVKSVAAPICFSALNHGTLGQELCERRRKVHWFSAFFFHVADCVRDGVDLCYGSSSSRLGGAVCFEVVVDSGRFATTASLMLGVELVQ